jgi:hypothetical protein
MPVSTSSLPILNFPIDCFRVLVQLVARRTGHHPDALPDQDSLHKLARNPLITSSRDFRQ